MVRTHPAALSQSFPQISFLGLLSSPSTLLSSAFWPLASESDGEDEFCEFVAEWWDADWEYARETNTLETVFPRWVELLRRAVKDYLPKTTDCMAGPEYAYLGKRQIILGKYLTYQFYLLLLEVAPGRSIRLNLPGGWI